MPNLSATTNTRSIELPIELAEQLQAEAKRSHKPIAKLCARGWKTGQGRNVFPRESSKVSYSWRCYMKSQFIEPQRMAIFDGYFSAGALASVS